MRRFLPIVCVLGISVVILSQGLPDKPKKSASPVETITAAQNTLVLTARHCAKYRRRDGSIDSAACRLDPTTVYYQSATHNLRTNGGADWWANQTVGGSNSTAATAQGRYLALSADTTAPAATDSTCTAELAGGLARAQAPATHTAGTTQTTLTYTWTYGASGNQSIAKVCAFNAASGGTLLLEALISPSATVSAPTDQFTVNYTVNF